MTTSLPLTPDELDAYALGSQAPPRVLLPELAQERPARGLDTYAYLRKQGLSKECGRRMLIGYLAGRWGMAAVLAKRALLDAVIRNAEQSHLGEDRGEGIGKTLWNP